jgi:hypothetical protein
MLSARHGIDLATAQRGRVLVSHYFVRILHESILEFIIITIAKVMLREVVQKVLISQEFVVIFLFFFCISTVAHIFLKFRMLV